MTQQCHCYSSMMSPLFCFCRDLLIQQQRAQESMMPNAWRGGRDSEGGRGREGRGIAREGGREGGGGREREGWRDSGEGKEGGRERKGEGGRDSEGGD